MSPKKLMFKTSTYASVPEYGKGLRLGIYQAQAAYGPGASAKNMDRLEKVASIAKERGVQLLSFPELYVPGYTLSPKEARKVAELIVGPTAADCYYTLPNGNRSAVPYPDVSTLVLPAFAYTNNGSSLFHVGRCG